MDPYIQLDRSSEIEATPHPRRNPGVICLQKLSLRVNFYDIILDDDPKHRRKYHYDVKIEQLQKASTSKSASSGTGKPRKQPTKLFKIVIIKFMKDYFPKFRYAYDLGSSIYTNELLMDKTDSFTETVEIMDPEREIIKEFSVTIKLADNGVIDLTDLPNKLVQGTVESKIIQAFDIIFKWYSACRPVIQTRKGFFPSAEQSVDIGGGKQIRRGFTHTVIPGTGLLLNVDVIYKIFPRSGSFIKGVIHDVCIPQKRGAPPIDLKRGLNENQEGNLEEFVKGLKVKLEMNTEKRIYRVDGLAPCPAKNFFDFNGRRITVQKYFEEEKRCNIEYPYLPCLMMKVGGQKRCYPIELAEILPNQAKNFRIGEFETRMIGEQATCRTDERQNKIKAEVSNTGLHRSQYFQDFGVKLSPDFKEVEGRVLVPPTITYKDGDVTPDKGQWNAGEFLQGKKLLKWGMLVFDKVENEVLWDFKNKLKEIGAKRGMEVAEPLERPRLEKPFISEQILKKILSDYKSRGFEFLFVIMPRIKELKSRVKKIAESKEIGLLTQCVLGKTLNNRRVFDSAVGNILLKNNTKLSGINHVLKIPPQVSCIRWFLNGKTMIFGADVTHPAPQDGHKIPSIAAVVANVDKEASLYKMEWSFQDRRIKDHEIIQDMEGMVSALLKSYKENVGDYPSRILFFRDGVSDGQIGDVRHREIGAIFSATKKLAESYIPLTFLIVQKRHSTRLFPLDKDKAKYDRKNYNVPPGTVVDREIVGQTMAPFYMVPHQSILGTARPTRYKIIWDECNVSLDEIEHIAYFLCHMFNRCTRVVSYPAPAFYAHLACYRIRDYLHTEEINMDNLEREKSRLEANIPFSTKYISFYM